VHVCAAVYAIGSLLSILSAAGGGGSGNSRGRLSRKEQAHLAELHGYFSKLVDDLTASVQHLAMLDFNNWLVRTAAMLGCNMLRCSASALVCKARNGAFSSSDME
jgi:hypothetical protein